MTYQFILFDMDGTLIDSSKGITDCVRETLKAMGLPTLSQNTLERFIGPTLWDSFNRYCSLSGEDLNRAVAIYRKLYTEGGIFDAYVYEGITGLLQSMRRASLKTAVATMKIESAMFPILEHFDLNKYFDTACGTTPEVKGGKKEVLERCLKKLGCDNKKDAVLVGDSPLDALGAMDAGIDFIAAEYGFGFIDREEIVKYPNVFIAETVHSLTEYFSE